MGLIPLVMTIKDMNNWEQFNQKFSIVFSRFYDMADENINLIRFSDISNMTALNEKTVSYQITLDNRIDSSPNNPYKWTSLSIYSSKFKNL